MTARRAVLRVLGATALIAGAGRGSAQQPARPAVVAVLWFASSGDPLAQKFFAVLRQRLRELGYVEGGRSFSSSASPTAARNGWPSSRRSWCR